jgi:hypothetical protein
VIHLICKNLSTSSVYMDLILAGAHPINSNSNCARFLVVGWLAEFFSELNTVFGCFVLSICIP